LTLNEYEMMVGLEVHVELLTMSKMFCRCRTRFGDPPNTNVCPACMGLPGALPVPNLQAVRLGMMAAMGLDAQINLRSGFDRKNYFYPDLTKGYQITQYRIPLAEAGFIEIADPPKKIRIRRVHLEEDTGKSIHAGDDITTAQYSLLDFNRSGVPLIEIVTEPDMSSPEEARQYLEKLQRVLRFAGVSDVKMEEGSMRVDCNISVRPRGADVPGKPVEIKNLSSFRAVVKALAYEFARQVRALRAGEAINRETRHWDEAKEITYAMRAKMTSEDYRYFPEPDLPDLVLDESFVEEVKRDMPRLPEEIVADYTERLGLPEYDAQVLTLDPNLSRFFDSCVERGADPKVAANWIMGEVMGYMNRQGLTYEEIPVSPEKLVELLGLVKSGTISGKIAKEVLVKVIETGKAPSAIVDEEGLTQVSDDDQLLAVIQEVVFANPGPVQDVKNGKEKAIGFLVGQVMKATKGRANPAKVNIMLKEKILS
jgi:aspartyl-tRNA(Asn)/glutamyl-tRNA(Gln) amidotransferase subunit B